MNVSLRQCGIGKHLMRQAALPQGHRQSILACDAESIWRDDGELSESSLDRLMIKIKTALRKLTKCLSSGDGVDYWGSGVDPRAYHKEPLLTKAVESDRYTPFTDSLCEVFQESFILAPIASGQTAAYPVRESDRLQFMRLCDLIERFAEGFKTRSGGIPPRRWLPRFELAVNVDDIPLATLRIAVNRDSAEKRSV